MDRGGAPPAAHSLAALAPVGKLCTCPRTWRQRSRRRTRWRQLPSPGPRWWRLWRLAIRAWHTGPSPPMACSGSISVFVAGRRVAALDPDISSPENARRFGCCAAEPSRRRRAPRRNGPCMEPPAIRAGQIRVRSALVPPGGGRSDRAKAVLRRFIGRTGPNRTGLGGRAPRPSGCIRGLEHRHPAGAGHSWRLSGRHHGGAVLVLEGQRHPRAQEHAPFGREYARQDRPRR